MNQQKNTVTLEDLLRVKRAEQPPPEFWAQFDRDLRAKQLAAIVEPRPWWAPFIRVGARLSHYQLPVGAAAVLALSLVTVNQYRPVNAPAYTPEVSLPAIPVDVSTVLANTPAPSLVATTVPSPAQLEYAPAVGASEAAADVLAVGQVSRSTPLESPAPALAEPSPSAQYIAANLAAAQAADPGLIDEVFGSGVRTVETREPMRDPLTQITSPGESRRSRLLATALPVRSGSEMAVRTNDRVARHLTEERLYDRISRIDVKEGRVAIKF